MDIWTFILVIAPLACYMWWWLALVFVRIGQAQYAKQTNGAYDNKDPRAQQQQLQGLARRAVNTMNNHAEGFGFFAAAAILNIAVRGPHNGSKTAAIFAIVHVAARLGHAIAYLANQDAIRSLMFFGGVICNFGLYVTAALA
eukprot:a687270_48.p3 GENE.a687270_48~~a687270_48.p3  ORF type:complete len:153 (-),score=48.47 a687270_48:155-580(-)